MPDVNLDKPNESPAVQAPMPGQNESMNLDNTISQMLSRLRPMSQLAAPGGMPKSPEPAKMATGPAQTKTEGTQLFLHNLGATVQQAVAAHKEKQIRTAMSDYSAIGTAWENAQMAAGDPSAPDYQQKAMQIFQQMPTVQAILGDPKKMKNIAKAFSQDWLNPEKTTVYGEALKRHMEADKAGKMMKLMQALHLKARQEPQLDPQQKQQLVQEEASRLPLSGGGGKLDASAARLMNEAIQLKKATMDKYEFKVVHDDKTGKDKFYAFDKSHPSAPAVEVKNAGGEHLSATPKASPGGTGAVVSVNTKPYGIKYRGEVMSASDLGREDVDPGVKNWLVKKLDDANRAWVMGNLEKEKVARIRGEMYNKGREYAVFDRASGMFRMASPNEIAQNPMNFGPAPQEQLAMTKEGIFTDINWNIGQLDRAAQKLTHDIDPKTRAALIAAFKSDDPNALTQFISSTVIANQPEDVQDFIAAAKSLNENALSLRVVGGMGQASDMVRRAIQDLFNVTSNRQFLGKQLKLMQGTVNRLHQAVPKTTLPQPIDDTQQNTNKVYGAGEVPD